MLILVLAGWSATREEHDWKTGDKEDWHRSMWMNLSEWIENVKILVSYVNVHQTVTLAEEDFEKVGGMACSVYTSSLFPKALLSLPTELTETVAVVVEVEVMHGLSSMDSHSPRSTWACQSLGAQSATNTESSVVISEVCGGRLMPYPLSQYHTQHFL